MIALLPAGATVGGWVVTHERAGPWRALPVGGPQSLTTIGAPHPHPNGKGALLPLMISGGAQQPALLVSLDHGQLQYFGADGQPWSPGALDDTAGCDLADGLGGAAPSGAALSQ